MRQRRKEEDEGLNKVNVNRWSDMTCTYIVVYYFVKNA
jgi:hypothetical protein